MLESGLTKEGDTGKGVLWKLSYQKGTYYLVWYIQGQGLDQVEMSSADSQECLYAEDSCTNHNKLRSVSCTQDIAYNSAICSTCCTPRSCSCTWQREYDTAIWLKGLLMAQSHRCECSTAIRRLHSRLFRVYNILAMLCVLNDSRSAGRPEVRGRRSGVRGLR